MRSDKKTLYVVTTATLVAVGVFITVLVQAFWYAPEDKAEKVVVQNYAPVLSENKKSQKPATPAIQVVLGHPGLIQAFIWM